MTAQDKETLKSYFVTGNVPTEQNYINLIDSFAPAGFGLGEGAKDISGLNANNFLQTGFYKGSSVLNFPTTEWCYLEVIRHNDSNVVQFLYQMRSDNFWARRKYNGTWNPWMLINGSDRGLWYPWTSYAQVHHGPLAVATHYFYRTTSFSVVPETAKALYVFILTDFSASNGILSVYKGSGGSWYLYLQNKGGWNWGNCIVPMIDDRFRVDVVNADTLTTYVRIMGWVE